MPVNRDEFTRPTTQANLLNGPFPWQQPVGVINIDSAGYAIADSGAIALITSGVDANIVTPIADATAHYVRYVDANNWIRARIFHSTAIFTYGTIQYLWEYTHQNPWHPQTHTEVGIDPSPDVWHWSPATPPADFNILHSHRREYEGLPTTHGHVTGSWKYLNQHRTTYSTSYQTVSDVILERCVNGFVSTIASVRFAPKEGNFKTTAVGTNIKVFYGDLVTAAIEQDVPEHRTGVLAGFGAISSNHAPKARLDWVEVQTLNDPPSAPLLTGPIGGQILDRAQPITMSHTFVDPDVGDAQSAGEWRWRRTDVLDAVWATSGIVITTRPSYTIAGATLVEAPYEWQVKVADRAGEWSDWSVVEFFKAGTVPAGPTITSSVPNGGGIPTSTYRETWSYPSQQQFEWRTVADNGGLPVETIIYASGAGGAVQREAQVPYPENGRAEHFQVRIMDGGLWSGWVSWRRLVSYTPPAKARIQILPSTDLGLMIITIDNPQPIGTQPSVIHNVLYRRELIDDDPDGEPINVIELRNPSDPQGGPLIVPENGTYLDPTPADVEFQYRVRTLGTNDVEGFSEWFG